MNQTELNERNELELLAGRVLGDLSVEESEQVESILADKQSSADILEDLERAAAGIQLAVYQPVEDPMPQSLRDRLSAEGLRIVSPEQTVQPSRAVELSSDGGNANRREWFAWLCAAAAFLVAIGLWRAEPTPGEKTAAVLRAELLSTADSLIRVDWSAGKTPFEETVTGDVVWDASSQTGFMRFENMPVNDPSVEQYQLWIIDPARDDEPIDGGVFDITESGEVIVEIDAKLNVIDPAAFAITIEKPGGVVVSTQERLPLLAAVE